MATQLTTIYFLHYTIPVFECELEDEWGCLEFEDGSWVIKIAKDLSSKDRNGTIIHELVHFVVEVVFGMELLECQVRMLSESLMTLATQNLEALEALTDALGRRKPLPTKPLQALWPSRDPGA